MVAPMRTEALNVLDDSERVRTVRLMILALLASALTISGLAFLLRWAVIPQICLVGAGSLAVAFALFRSGRFRSAVWLTAATSIYVVMHAAARRDGIQSIGLAFIPVLIVLVSLLFDWFMLTLFTVVAILATCGMLATRYFLLREERFSVNDVGDLCIFAVTCAVAAFLGRRVVSQINHAFMQVRESESRYRDTAEQLRRRAEELQQIMDVAPVALFVANDPECREVIINRMGNALFELPPTANSRSAPAGPIPPASFFRAGVEISARELPLQAAARGIEVQDAEFDVALPSGARRILRGHARPLRDARGEVRGAIAVAEDVTDERRRTAALLRESEERFRHAADATPIMIWFSDAQNRLAFVNHEFLRFTGQTYEELLGDQWSDPIHPDDVPHIQAMYGAYLRRPAAYQVEFRMRRVDGEYRHMLSSLGPRYAGETYLGWAGSTIDITDLKHRQHEDLARQKLESVGTLAGGIAHDFNNLLGAVLAQAELAQAELVGGSSPEGELNSIREIAMRGSKIVRELMIYAGKESKILELVDVSEAVKEILELLKLSVSKHVTFRINLQQDLPPVRAGAAQISQLAMNLATNASEALGDRDGVISITTRRVIVGHGFPGQWQGLAHGEYVQVAVSDTGCGIPPELRTRIFDPFFSTKAGSRGFGLAVVHGIVKDLAGAINVVSEPGHGTTFEILLPSAQTPSEAIREPISGDGQPARQSQALAVLIVEDEDALRQAVSKMLRKHGFHVIETPDGSAALDALRACANPLHVLFLDITIPGASAREVLLEARRLRPELKVIVTSAYPEEMAGSLLQSAIDHFIRKPYQVDHLVRLIDSTKS